MNIKEIIDRISSTHMAEKKDIIAIIENNSNDEYLFESADNIRKQIYGKDVYIRGLIELSNYCKNNCYYCGIQGSNPNANRYRLSKEEILSACENGYQLGYRSFVLQGGEDPHYTDEIMVPIVAEIRKRYPDCASKLSLGERS